MRLLLLLLATLTAGQAWGQARGLVRNRDVARRADTALLRLALTGDCEGTTPSGLTFSRTSTATCTKADGTLVTLASGAPRLEADGLLVEGAATNLLLQSQGPYDSAPWSRESAGTTAPTVTANAATAPDGTTTASLVAFPAVGAGQASLFRETATATAAVHGASCYMRAASGSPTLYISAFDGVSTYHRQACTPGASWGRCVLTTGALTATGWRIQVGVDARDASQSAQPAQSVYVWGCQLETGSIATSYIPTLGTTATRAGDNVTTPHPLSGQAATDWCMSTRVRTQNWGARAAWVTGQTSSTANTARFLTSGSSFALSAWDVTNTVRILTVTNTLTPNTFYTLKGCGDAVGNLAAYIDGALQAGSLSGAGTGIVSTHSTVLRIGSTDTGPSNAVNGHISNVCFSGPAGGC